MRPLLVRAILGVPLVVSACLTFEPSPSASPPQTPTVATTQPSFKPTAPAPACPRWDAMREAPVPGRSGHVAIWTGAEMLVWGGRETDFAAGPEPKPPPLVGLSYDPRTDSWRLTAEAPIDGRVAPAAAWTGQEMLIWGGWSVDAEPEPLEDGAAYDPAADHWRVLPPSPFTTTGTPVAAWTGEAWLVVVAQAQEHGVTLHEAATYDPRTDRWTALDPLTAPASFVPLAMTWVEDRVVVIVSPNDRPAVAFERAQDRDDHWGPAPAPPLDGRLASAGAVATRIGAVTVATGTAALPGDRVYALGPRGWRSFAAPPDGLRTIDGVWADPYVLYVNGDGGTMLDVDLDAWTSLPPPPAELASPSRVWTGDRLLVWGGERGESRMLPRELLQLTFAAC